MSQALENLPMLLGLERIGGGLFHGQGENLDLRQVFGDQVVGQILYATKETVPDERLVHSFHSYFPRPGDSKKPIIYDVEALHDGNSFSAYRISAIQNGKSIFYMTAPFQAPETDFEYQKTISPAPAPDGLSSETQIVQPLAHLLLPVLKDKFISDRPPEVRPAEFHNPLKRHVAKPHRQVQVCANGSMPNDLHVYQYPLGYVSDLNFLPVALQPYGIGFLKPGIQIVIIDYSMWFHRPFNLSEWLPYNVESISASSVRGFVRDEFCTQDDVLVASTIQEGVIRNHNQKNNRR